MASFRYAFTLDTNPDERKRGVTIALKRRTFETKKFSFTLLDGPGHVDFIRNMITGASNANVGLLFTSAKEGEFETSIQSSAESHSRHPGQTREHCQLCKIFGVEQLVIIVNKMDQAEWSERRFRDISKELLRLTQEVGFNQSNVQTIPISGLVGDNLTRSSEHMNWYRGRTLVDALDNLRVPRSAIAHSLPLRIPVQKVLRKAGIGNIALGRIETGVLHQGDVVRIEPGASKGYVRSIEMWNKILGEAWPGDGVGINIRGVNPTYLRPGAVICDPDHPAQLVGPDTAFIAEIVVFDHPSAIKPNYCPTLFTHTAHVPCRITSLKAKLDRDSMQTTETNPEFLRNGDVGLISISPLQPIAMEKFSDFPQLGRFALRDNGRTIAAGKVSDIPSRQLIQQVVNQRR
jgi:elongation factor 1-alpha